MKKILMIVGLLFLLCVGLVETLLPRIGAGALDAALREALKTDQLLREGDKIVLRGKGRVILSEIGGSSRKERIRVTYQVYR